MREAIAADLAEPAVLRFIGNGSVLHECHVEGDSYL